MLKFIYLHRKVCFISFLSYLCMVIIKQLEIMKTIAFDELVNLEYTTIYKSLSTELALKVMEHCNGYKLDPITGKITIQGVFVKRISLIVNILNNG